MTATIASCSADGKVYGFSEIRSGSIDSWHGSSLAPNITDFGIAHGSFWHEALGIDYDEANDWAFRCVDFCLETTERYDEQGAWDGLDATLEFSTGSITIDELHTCEANGLINGVCKKTLAPPTDDPIYYQYEDERPFRDRIRARWNWADELREQIAAIEVDVLEYFERVREHPVHPALVLWTARAIAWLLFHEELEAYFDAEPEPPPNPEGDALMACLAEQNRLYDIGVPEALIAKRDACWATCRGKWADAALDAYDLARKECQRASAAHWHERDKAIAPELVERRIACYTAHKTGPIESGRWRAYLDALQICEDAYQAATRPTIWTSGRQPREITKDVLKVLRDVRPPLYSRGDGVARITTNADGSPMSEGLSDEWLRGCVHQHANIMKTMKNGNTTPDRLQLDAIKEARAYGRDQLPRLEGITASPFGLDGSHAARGYDPSTRLYHDIPELPPILRTLSRDEIVHARDGLLDVFSEFSFEDDASKANAIGALLTIVARSMIAGPTPAFTVTAPKAGTGKTFLVEVVVMIAQGVRISATALAGNEEERQKIILGLLRSSLSTILFDNCVGTLNSPVLAGMLTAGYFQGRILGRSEVTSVPNLSTLFLTGNNLTISGELSRRRVPIKLDPKTARPESRQFKRPNLLHYVKDHRVELLHAACVLVHAWLAAGRPKAEVPMMNSFGRWSELVGGVLAHADIKGFLDNLKQASQDDDIESNEWEVFLAFIHTRTNGEPFTAAFLHDLAVADGGFKMQNDVVMLLPGELADLLAKYPRTFAKRLGSAFRDRHRTRFGPYRLEREGETRHRVTLWKVEKDG